MKTKLLIHRFVLAAFVLSMAPVGASAQLVNVDLGTANQSHFMEGAAVLGEAGDYWNIISTPSNWDTISADLLENAESAQTTISLLIECMDVDGNVISNGRVFNADINKPERAPFIASNAVDLMRDYLYLSFGVRGGGEPDTAHSMKTTLSGLEKNATYRLVLYGAGDQMGQGATFQDFSAGTNVIFTTQAGDASDTLAENEDYVVFEFETGDSDTISFHVGRGPASTFAIFNGFQLEKK